MREVRPKGEREYDRNRSTGAPAGPVTGRLSDRNREGRDPQGPGGNALEPHGGSRKAGYELPLAALPVEETSAGRE